VKNDKQIAFRLAVQRNRAAVYLLAAVLALGSRAAGTLEAHYGEIILVIGGAFLSVLVFSLLAATAPGRKAGKALDIAWMLTDAVLIGWGVLITGGGDSPWYLWYLANISGAAFVARTRTAVAIGLIDLLSYCGALALGGDVSGFNHSLYLPITRIAFLVGASFFFLRGVTLLRHKRAEVRRMRDEARAQVEELKRLTAALDQRTRELSEANLRIREADRAKSQFLANMSHELRTPLNSIIGFSEVLQTRLEDRLDERYRRFLGNINESGRHLLGIINDVLDLSKIEAGKTELNIEDVSAPEIISSVCTVMKGQAQKRGITFEIRFPDDLPPFPGDPVRVKQVLYNLLSNAVKFSHDGGAVEIRAAVVETEASPLERPAMVFEVQDHGIGIDPSKHAAIFEEFEQADGTTTRKYGGTGLGLALVRRFMEMHGGQVRVDSRLGEGCTFAVFFPLEGPEGDRPPVIRPPVVSLDGPEGRRVLIVEDDPTAFENLAGGLAERSWLPVRARDAEEALRLVRVIRPVVILLDIVLPGMDGWELLKRLKADPESRDIPVIVVSLMENRELGLTLGAVDYFVKPVRPSALALRLRELIPPERDGPARLLIIDDDPKLHELLDLQLEETGYELYHAISGEEGLRRAAELRPSIIVLDLMMEAMDGFVVAARLRESPATSGIPIVVYTQKEMTREDLERLKGRAEILVDKGKEGIDRLQEAVEQLLSWKRGGHSTHD